MRRDDSSRGRWAPSSISVGGRLTSRLMASDIGIRSTERGATVHRDVLTGHVARSARGEIERPRVGGSIPPLATIRSGSIPIG
jgi:hypothetical protein